MRLINDPRRISSAGGRVAANFSRCRRASLCFTNYIETSNASSGQYIHIRSAGENEAVAWRPFKRPSRPLFNRHNFTNYAESRYGSLLVTNDYGIVGGRDDEDDESYRYRIHLKLVSNSGSDEAAMRFQILQVPGIQDVVFDRRAGTFTAYVYGITPVAAASVLSAVQSAIDDHVAFPLTGTAVNPDLVGISLTTTFAP